MTKEETKRKFFKDCYNDFHVDQKSLIIFNWWWSLIESKDKEIVSVKRIITSQESELRRLNKKAHKPNLK